MKIAVAPISYYWPRQKVFDFYQQLAKLPVDIVYLGETICSKRNQLRLTDWLAIAKELSHQGKECILSTLCLLESQSDVSRVKKICEQKEFMVEANDYAALHFLSETQHAFVTGASLNLYSIDAIDSIANDSMHRWMAPIEMGYKALHPMVEKIKNKKLQVELLAYGYLPLAYSARCFTARKDNVSKDQCERRCINDPEGIAVYSQNDERLFTINGIQTQSGRKQNLITEIAKILQMGIDVVRLEPGGDDFFAVIDAFAQAINSKGERVNLSFDQQQYCDGYWHQKDGHQLIGRFE